MHRKSFIKNTALCAIAFSTPGFIRFNGERYEGDCETTSDILGPFYRPNSPVRTNLVTKDTPGQLVELSGILPIVMIKDSIRSKPFYPLRMMQVVSSDPRIFI